MSEKIPNSSSEYNGASELPSKEEILSGFQDRRIELDSEVANFESRGQDIPANLQEAVDSFNFEWNSLGGDLVDKAEASVGELNFNSTPEERAEARLALSETQDRFYDNYMASQKAEEALADNSEVDEYFSGIGDIIDIDSDGRGHRPDGKFLSQQEMRDIEANQDLIRDHADNRGTNTFELPWAPGEGQAIDESSYEFYSSDNLPSIGESVIVSRTDGGFTEATVKSVAVDGDRDRVKVHWTGEDGTGYVKTVEVSQLRHEIKEKNDDIDSRSQADAAPLYTRISGGEPTPVIRRRASSRVESGTRRPEELKSLDLSIEALKAEDKDILEQSTRARVEIINLTREALSGVTDLIADTKNALSRPKNMILRLRHDRAQRKYNRAKAKIGSSFFKLRNRHFENVAEKRRVKLEDRESSHSTHTDKMEGRLALANEKNEARSEVLNRRLEDYKQTKLAAEERKAKRRLRREKRREGMGYIDRSKAMNNLTDRDRARIRKLAIQSIQARMDR